MRQWGLHQGLEEEKEDGSNPLNPGNFKKVKLLGDGACLFTRGMGMSCTWTTERGFGERSWRYAMVINDMRIEKLYIEVSAPPSMYCTRNKSSLMWILRFVGVVRALLITLHHIFFLF